MSEAVYIFWCVIQGVIGINLVSPFVLFLIYLSIPKRTFRKQIGEGVKADYAIIVTAYQETHMLPAVVSSILKVHYDRYLVYIVADNCEISHLRFDDDRVILLRPETVLASNTRSHFYAIEHFKRPHNRLTIIDSDNLVDPAYLNELDAYFDRGFKAVQGVRKAKNTDGLYASLDAARDIYYHFYDGKILFNVGSSATLAGSGMAFTVDLYKTCLAHLDIVGAGFDKVLQYEIVRRGKRIAYAEKAVVYDEKTTYSEQLVHQRARWINTWFKYFSLGFGLVGRGICRFNWNQVVFGFTLLRPPLFLFLLSALFFMVVNLFVIPSHTMGWLVAFGVFVSGFFVALVVSGADCKIYKALMGIPLFVYYQLVSLVKVRRANKLSVATRHGYDREKQVEDVGR